MIDQKEIKARIFTSEIHFNGTIRRKLELYLQVGENCLDAKNIVFRKIEPGEIIEPIALLPYPAGQILMDDLWAAGIRPTEGTGSAGSLLATEKHLSDMRIIAFNQLGIKAD